jgi:hypothetical protein
VAGRTKERVYGEYGIHELDPYEIDHPIPLELGSSNDIRNLWRESYDTQPWNSERMSSKIDFVIWSVRTR